MPDILIKTPARAGILGNPSDGFFGKTISILIRNFHAEIKLSELVPSILVSSIALL